MSNFKNCDVLVLGAGIAGLVAARTLAEAGKSVILVEARDRIGGRILSLSAQGSDLPIELGAEFIHGRAPELWQLIEEAGLGNYELDGQFLCFQNYVLTECDNSDTFQLLEDLSEDAPDMSFAEWIAQKNASPANVQSAISFVEGFNAADAHRIGTAALAKQQAAEDEIEGFRAFRIEAGYVALAEYLLKKFEQAGGQLSLSTVVQSVTWERGKVRVRTISGETIEAAQCVITLPLGVLQAGSVQFQPAPAQVLQAAEQLAMGSAKRVTFVFREPFWHAQYPDAGFIFAQNELPRVWWTPAPNAAPSLTGWIGGTRALNPAVAEKEDFADVALRTLAKLFAIPEKQLRELVVSWHTHDWQRDPFTLGAYSYAPKGALHASDAMTKPVESTLFFAGEHTDTTGHWGTVHGALRSGLRAAKQILEA